MLADASTISPSSENEMRREDLNVPSAAHPYNNLYERRHASTRPLDIMYE